MNQPAKSLFLTGLLVAASAAPIAYAHDHDNKPTDKTPATKEHDDHDPDHDDHDHGHNDHGKPGESHAGEVKLTETAIRQSGVRVGKADKRVLHSSVVAPARLSFNADAMAHVGSAVQGRAIEIKVRAGDLVKQGDVLVVVESPELGRSQSAYLQRRIEAEAALAAVEPAKEAYDRARNLFDESQGIALAEVQKRDAEYRAAIGARAAGESAVLAAASELHLLGMTQDDIKKLIETRKIDPQYTIRAPITGKVIEREVTLGELVSPEKEKLMTIADATSYWAWADVPETRLGEIGVGSRAEIAIAALSGEPIEGEVSFVSSEIDPGTRSARFRIVVDNRDDKLMAGMFARITLFAPRGQAVLAIPEEAVQTIDGKPSVFVVVEGQANTFARREVAIGKAVAGYVPVTAGLKENEMLVVGGTFVLKAELGKGEAGHEH